MLKKHTYQRFGCLINRRFMCCKGTTFNSKPLDNRCFLSQLPPSSLKIQSVDGRTPCAIRPAFFYPTFSMAKIQIIIIETIPPFGRTFCLMQSDYFYLVSAVTTAQGISVTTAFPVNLYGSVVRIELYFSTFLPLMSMSSSAKIKVVAVSLLSPLQATVTFVL